MTTETLMTDQATTTTEGQAASQAAASTADQGAAPAAGEQAAQQQQAAEGQTTEAQGEGGEATGEGKPAGAPEKYDFKAPEGKEFDAQVVSAFGEVAKELNLPQEAAQKILDKMGPVMEAQMNQALDTAKSQWREQSTSDKEFGGEKLPENLALAKKAMDQFASTELRELLESTGMGNNPEVIRVFYRVGKAISEDSFINGTRKPASAGDDPAKRLFPNQA